MNQLSISYTLHPQGQNYDLVKSFIDLISTTYAHLDESQYVIRTPFSPILVEMLLSAVIDANDGYAVLSVAGIRTNWKLEWRPGLQASARGKLESRRMIQELRLRALRLRARCA